MSLSQFHCSNVNLILNLKYSTLQRLKGEEAQFRKKLARLASAL